MHWGLGAWRVDKMNYWEALLFVTFKPSFLTCAINSLFFSLSAISGVGKRPEVFGDGFLLEWWDFDI